MKIYSRNSFKTFFLFVAFLTICREIASAERDNNINKIFSDVKLVNVEWNSFRYREHYKTYFLDMLNKPFDKLSFKIKSDQVVKELYLAGYFNAQVTTDFKQDIPGKIVALIKVVLGERVLLEVKGVNLFSVQEIKAKILDKIKIEFNKIDPEYIKTFLVEIYEDAGFYNSKVIIRTVPGKDNENGKVVNYYITVEEGKKIKLTEILFRGNKEFPSEKIKEIYLNNVTPLASNGYYDKIYLSNFTDILKKEYLKNGYVFAEVSKPRIIGSESERQISVEYGIIEKNQILIKDIILKNILSPLREEALSVIVNKKGTPLNVVEIENDLRTLVTFFQEKGYYFTTISNVNSNNLLNYNKSMTQVEFNPEINLENKVCFNHVILNGNVKTQSEVILREIELTEGELVTPSKVEKISQKLSSLGLFSSLKLAPYAIFETESGNKDVTCPRSNLVIYIKEKDFGLFEVSPGYRTDLGAKLATGITYNNLFGMNRQASFFVQANRRFSLDGFDEKRKSRKKDLLEYSLKATYVDPYIFHGILKSQLEFEQTSSFQRIRYAGFDADVFKISPQISKNFKNYKWFSTALKYQFERVVTFDATQAKDNDNYSIGSITPSITLDFRDNPRKGAFFTLSSEWANSHFGSIKKDDLEINFVKIIARNKFYYPMGDFTLAVSLAGGFQKNFAREPLVDGAGQTVYNEDPIPRARTRGYIPSIKVFRLDGYDEIRGYDQGEINRIDDKFATPINRLTIQNTAYFTAFKLEPRYNVTDALQLGIFYDAGRLFVDHFRPFKLRSSVGLGLKFLTPVGSLDFDYGFKLHRKNYLDGKKDSVGRFHLSIGFF